jgi:hypothetical protein
LSRTVVAYPLDELGVRARRSALFAELSANPVRFSFETLTLFSSQTGQPLQLMVGQEPA